MSRRPSLRSQFFGMFASGAFLTLALQPTHVRSASGATDPVTIKGAGGQAVAPEMTPWGDTMASTEHPTNMQYIGAGSGDALGLFKLQNLDYVISGVPYTDNELAGTHLIRAPITITAGVPLVTRPRKIGTSAGWQSTITVDHLGSDGGQWADCLNDPNDPDYDFALCEEVTVTPFTAPIRIPPKNFAAMFLDYPYSPGADATVAYREWGQPDIATALGATLPDAWRAFQAVPQVVNRTERSASNLYLQEYAKTMAPSIWDALKAGTPGVTWDPPSEQFPVGVTRFGLETAIGVAAVGGVSAPSLPYNSSNLVFVPAAWADKTIADYAIAEFRKIEIMNGAGQFVAASTASIDAAVAAGGEQPLYAADHVVPDAYPITWTNYIYVPAHGLSIDKTNALAATIRFLATSGQNDAAALGDGHLTSAMAQRAIEAADSVVTSNCTGADRTVVEAAVGGWEPDLPELDALGTVKRCEAVTPPPPTTTTTTTTTVAPTSTSTTTSTTVATSVAPITTGAPTTRAATTAATTPTTEAASSDTTEVTQPLPEETSTSPPPATPTTKAPAVKLPLPVPSDGRGGFKSLATFVMGSGLFLVGRKIVAGILGAL